MAFFSPNSNTMIKSNQIWPDCFSLDAPFWAQSEPWVFFTLCRWLGHDGILVPLIKFKVHVLCFGLFQSKQFLSEKKSKVTPVKRESNGISSNYEITEVGTRLRKMCVLTHSNLNGDVTCGKVIDFLKRCMTLLLFKMCQWQKWW